MKKAINWLSSAFSSSSSSSSSLKSVDNQGVTLDWSYESPRFFLDSPSSCTAALEYLDKEGYVIIGNVMNNNEIDIAKQLFWDHWTNLYVPRQYPFKITRNDPGSYSNIPLVSALGIVNGYGIGQSDFLWYCRQNKKIRKAFELVWGGEKALLTSFDGCGIFRPYHWKPAKKNKKNKKRKSSDEKNDENRSKEEGETDNNNNDKSSESSSTRTPLTSQEAQRWKTKNGWHHIDQNIFTKPNKICVQGLLSMYDATPHTGGLVVIPGSHLTTKDLLKDLVSSKSRTDYMRIPAGHPSLVNAQARVVQCKAGDFIMWDSRTIHCNTPALLTPNSPQNDLIRLVAYICMTPASFASNLSELIDYRKSAFINNISTSHWPHEYYANDNPKDIKKKSFHDANKSIQALIIGVDPRELGVVDDNDNDNKQNNNSNNNDTTTTNNNNNNNDSNNNNNNNSMEEEKNTEIADGKNDSNDENEMKS